MRIPSFRNINVQLGLLLLLCVGLFHVSTTLILLLTEPRPGDPRDEGAAIVVAAVTALDAASPTERPAITVALNASLPRFHVSLSTPDGPAATGARPVYFHSRLPAGVELGVVHDEEGERLMGSLHDGERIMLTAVAARPGLHKFALVTMGFVAVSLFVFSLWAALSLTRPLTDFANAAETFSLDKEPAQLPETGPEEVRKATRAFNRMRNRISQMAAQRTRMLAAVSHDLRTPITRMRLRAEHIENGDTKTKLLRDLDQMEAMVSGCLDYLRGGSRQETVLFDLATLLQAVVDQFTDLGADARYDGVDHTNVMGNPDDFERAFSNLLDNAVKYASSPEIKLFEKDGWTVVEVVDKGSGIPAEKREAMLEPFERGGVNASSHAREGFGLGLAITRAIVESHGGRLELDERAGGGLVARVFLPTVELETKRNDSSKLTP
ncbi:ATP-binding protein [Methylocystis bryophila]|uniref:histidine kinase n=1 Tax=Methylocystis bryophila TaxID=655015 RepID=A0A1W6MXE4_9HYPH|nr:ATP-binding protein [Methylocystis bryophila]ARN82209.1 two-component sensor histidine kinase [Methylocystis bryophila]BDV38342.1 two-component sensor histidine kinase [Methylocystis bryophila]